MPESEKLNILIIEDNDGDARLLTEMLKTADGFQFEIVWADSFAQGVKHLSKKISDMVMLDLSLPDSIGLETYLHLRQFAPDIPVIIMTGNDDKEMAVNAVRAGAQDYIYKSEIDERTLVRALLYARERHRLQLELKAANRKILEQHKQVIEEERLKVLLQMAGATSHELNQPLMSLLCTIELMRMQKDVPPGWNKHMTRLEIAGRRIADIIKQISSIRSIELKPYASSEQIINFDQRLHVMVLEDNTIDFEQLKAHLIHFPKVFLTRAVSLAHAKKQLRGETFDLIIVDYLLPDGRGLDLLAWLEMEKLEIPVLSISGRGDEIIASQMIKAGACDHLPKAIIDSETLSRSIFNAMEKFRLKQEVAKATQKVVQMATRDPLTGLYNRNFMHDTLKNEIERIKRQRTDLACLMLDLDYFKQINDTYGHSFGDRVLKQVADCLLANLRKSDFAFRYGGEEFVVLLPQTGVYGAQKIAEKLKCACQALKIEDGENSVQVTVSIGVATTSQLEAIDGDDLIAGADEALYQAKAQGRSRVKLYNREVFVMDSTERLKHIKERLSDLAEKVRRTSAEAMELMTRDMGGERFKPHNQQVVRYLETLGARLKLAPHVIKSLQRAAIFHDYSKVLLGNCYEEARLKPEQIQQIQTHPVTINQLMEPFNLFADEQTVLLRHHENWDGSGYPGGLEGKAIPLGGRLFAAVDALVSMTNPRPHRPAYKDDEAVRELADHAGTQFDPSVVMHLLKLIAEEKTMDVPQQLFDQAFEQLQHKGATLDIC